MKCLIIALLLIGTLAISPHPTGPIEKVGSYDKVMVTKTIVKTPYPNAFIITYSRIEKENIPCIVDKFEQYTNIYWNVAVMFDKREVNPIATTLLWEVISFYPEGNRTIDMVILSDTNVDGKIETAKRIYKVKNDKEEEISSIEEKIDITDELQKEWENYLMYMHSKWEEDKKVLRGKKT